LTSEHNSQTSKLVSSNIGKERVILTWEIHRD
jgi:hypothetical protein